MEKKRYYKQVKDVTWLDTSIGDFWIKEENSHYIQPENESNRTTPLGVDLTLVDMDNLNEFPFEELRTIEVNDGKNIPWFKKFKNWFTKK